jgi:hypothetical protein
MEPFDRLRILAGTLERLQLDYLVTGSMATIAYGEPRLTNTTSMSSSHSPWDRSRRSAPRSRRSTFT